MVKNNSANSQQVIIAIDGYSSCGKSTIARSLAEKLNYRYIDSGAMYRAITYYFINNNIPVPTQKEWDSNKDFYQEHLKNIEITFKVNDEGKSETYLNGDNVETEIRRMIVSENVSKMSKIKEVREHLVHLQKSYGKEGGIVMDGRDIGTVVFPGAEVKIFMTASPDIRAHRRFLELQEAGINASEDDILRNLIQRDHEDSTRDESPLSLADDAVLLDNSHLTHEEQLSYVMELVTNRISAADYNS